MKILVTGANGYLGQGVVKALLDLNQEVIAVGHSTENVDVRAKRINCDIFQIEQPYDFFGQPNVLLHMAWRDGFVHYSDAHIYDLPLHYNFMKKMVESPIKTIACMGSMHEIGFYEGCINEKTPCSPESYYGIAKNSLREITQLMAKNKNKIFQWLRGYYIVGNTEFGSSVFSKIAQAEKKGQQTFPFTMGQNQFDFINYDEFCYQVAKTVIQDRVNGIINICSGHPEKLADRVEAFLRENNFNIRLEYGTFPDRPYDSKAVWGDNKKIQEILSKN